MHFKQGAGRRPICRWQLATDDVQIVDGVHFFFAVSGKRHQIRPIKCGGDAVRRWRTTGGSGAQTGGWGGDDLHTSRRQNDLNPRLYSDKRRAAAAEVRAASGLIGSRSATLAFESHSGLLLLKCDLAN